MTKAKRGSALNGPWRKASPTPHAGQYEWRPGTNRDEMSSPHEGHVLRRNVRPQLNEWRCESARLTAFAKATASPPKL